MGRVRRHDEDVLLDAARAVVLTRGVRAATIAALSAAGGAPSGSIYHAFGSRQGVLAALWARATTRAQEAWLAAGDAHPDDAVEAGVAMALSVPELARREPDDVRVLGVLRPADFPDAGLDLAVHNKAVRDGLRRLAARLTGPDAVLRAHLATIELPTGAVRMRLGSADLGVPPELDRYVAAAARAVLLDPTGGEPRPQAGDAR